MKQTDEPKLLSHFYRAEYSRYLAKREACEEFNEANSKTGGKLLAGVIADVDGPLPQVPPIEKKDRKGEDKKICIIGAGAAGLFTGLLFDYLKEQKVLGHEVEYTILDAADPKRKGGRLYTYDFPPRADPKENGSHDYYDVGAMRFPHAPMMSKVFRLFKLLDMPVGNPDSQEAGAIIPYYMHSQWPINPVENRKCFDPWYFNDIKSIGFPKTDNPFEMSSDGPGGKIDPQALKNGPSATLGKIIRDFIDKNDIVNKETNAVDFKKLLEFDIYSTRSYLMNVIKYEYSTIQYLETFEAGTGWYDQAWTETVLEFLDFNPLKAPADTSSQPALDAPEDLSYTWSCINGGTKEFVKRMHDRVKNPPKYNREVTAISQTGVGNYIALEVKDSQNTAGETYDAVFTSAPLGCMRRMDLSGIKNLDYRIKAAMRTLYYGPSAKVGIKFKSPWWRKTPFKVGLGGVAYTDGNLRMCVYPSYALKDDEPGVIIASYSWTQDAQRLSTLISKQSPANEDELKKLLIHELALLHAVEDIPATADNPEEKGITYDEVKRLLEEQYLDHYGWNWYGDNNATGAFAFFGPQQYQGLYPALTSPQANNNLFFMGEAASAYHAWVIGALDSSLRAVHQWCEHNGYTEAMKLLEKPPFDPSKKPTDEFYYDTPFGPVNPDYAEILKFQTRVKETKLDVEAAAETAEAGTQT